MIKLDIQPYCEDCLMFDADVEAAHKVFNESIYIGDFRLTDTIVRCSRRKLCEGLKRHLEKEMRGENSDA